MWLRICLCAMVFGSLVSLRALADDQFIRVADTSTLIPGSTVHFRSFAGEPGNDDPVDPSLDDGYVAFTGHITPAVDGYGVFSWHDGMINKVVDNKTPVPGSTGTFTAFRSPGAGGPDVSFIGFSNFNSDEGIYLSSGASLQKVADPRTTLPGGGTFVAAGITPISGGDVFFENDSRALYRFHNGAVALVAGVGTPLPGGGTFTDFNSNLAGRGGSVAFYARGENGGNNVAGIYAYTGGSLVRIVDTNTPLPGGGGNFRGFNNIALGSDGRTVIFQALDTSPTQGIYVSTDGVISKLTDSDIPNIQTNGLELAAGGGHVAFLQDATIYSDLTGTLERTVGPGDMIFGKRAVAIGMGASALSGSQLAFSATFTDGTSGIFLIPEPSGIALAAAGAAGLLARRRERRR